MAKINKFGEIDEMACPGCSGPIKAEWVACPTCGEGLKASKAQKAKKQKPPLQNKFICPGCGEKATASEGAILCATCNAFVHKSCMKSTDITVKKRLLHEESKWICRCPVCGIVLCHAYNNGDCTGTHYVNE